MTRDNREDRTVSVSHNGLDFEVSGVYTPSIKYQIIGGGIFAHYEIEPLPGKFEAEEILLEGVSIKDLMKESIVTELEELAYLNLED